MTNHWEGNIIAKLIKLPFQLHISYSALETQYTFLFIVSFFFCYTNAVFVSYIRGTDLCFYIHRSFRASSKNCPFHYTKPPTLFFWQFSFQLCRISFKFTDTWDNFKVGVENRNIGNTLHWWKLLIFIDQSKLH